jgi:thiol:disulfide interchange protein DsbC
MTDRRNSLAGVLAALVLLAGGSAWGFMGDGCGQGKCTDCHSLTREEAQTALKDVVDRVLDVRLGEIPGLWAVDVEKQGRRIPVYMDFSRRFLLTGDVIELQTMESVVRERMISLNRIDPSVIPLDDALVIGDPEAPTKIVVFDDPECPYCQKIHGEMKAVVAQRKDIAFFIKLFPLKIHPDARRKAKAILCAKSLEMFEDSLAGRPVPDPTCETDQVDRNEALARQIGVGSTPTLVFPDGRVAPGFKDAAKIISYLEEGAAAEAKTTAGAPKP